MVGLTGSLLPKSDLHAHGSWRVMPSPVSNAKSKRHDNGIWFSSGTSARLLLFSRRYQAPPCGYVGLTNVLFIMFTHLTQRLTLGLMVAELNNGQRTRKLDVMRIGGTGCVVIKHGRKPKLDPTPADVALDIDVSLRQAQITLGTDECAGLCALSSAYITLAEQPAVGVADDVSTAVATKPAKPLFREDFWYFESDGKSTSGELNFDTLSGLLEQVKVFIRMAVPFVCASSLDDSICA